MRRYLLVLDRDLVTADEPGPGPVAYLADRLKQEPCQVTVLALVTTRPAPVPPVMRVRMFRNVGRLTEASLPEHEVRAAEDRMNSAVSPLEEAGCHAVGVITHQRRLDLAVRGEMHGRQYDEVILVTGQNSGTALARMLRLDPVHRLRLRLGHRLTVFAPGVASRQAAPAP